jgi:hypothetical protein
VDIKTNTLFIPIGRLENDTLTVFKGEIVSGHIRPIALRITGGRFNLENLRPQIAQNGNGAWTGMKKTVFNDPDSIQGSRQVLLCCARVTHIKKLNSNFNLVHRFISTLSALVEKNITANMLP